MSTTRYDVVIVGGGTAGLSAATTLARALRSVLVIDSGTPRNASAAGVHGYLSRDGMNPLELLSIGRSEVLSYGGTVIDGEAVSAGQTPRRFRCDSRRCPPVLRQAPPGHHRLDGRAASHRRAAGAMGEGRGALPLLPWLGNPRATDWSAGHRP